MFTGFLLHRRNANRAPSTGGQASRNRIDFVRMKQRGKKKVTRVHARIHGLVVEGAENVVKIEIDGAGIVCARNLRRERNEYLSHRLPRLFLFDITSRRRRYSNQARAILSNPGVKMACALKRANGNKGGDDNKNVGWWNLIVKRRR